MKHEIEIEDGIIPEGYEVVRFGIHKDSDEAFLMKSNQVRHTDAGWSTNSPSLILRKIPDPFEEVKEQLRNCFKEGTRFCLKMYGWCWFDSRPCMVWRPLPDEINWPDVPVGTEFEL